MGAKAAGSHGQAETKAHKTQNASQPNNDSQRPVGNQCPAKRGAKTAASHYATDFYAKQTVASGA